MTVKVQANGAMRTPEEVLEGPEARDYARTVLEREQVAASAAAGEAAMAPTGKLEADILRIAAHLAYGDGRAITFVHDGQPFVALILAPTDAHAATITRGTTPTTGYHKLAAVAGKSANALVAVPTGVPASKLWPEVTHFQVSASVTAFDQSEQGKSKRMALEVAAEIKRALGALDREQQQALARVHSASREQAARMWAPAFESKRRQVEDEIRVNAGLAPLYSTADKGISHTAPLHTASGPVAVSTEVQAPVSASDPFAGVEAQPADVLDGVTDEKSAISLLGGLIRERKLTKVQAMERLNEWRTAQSLEAFAFEAEASAS